MKTPNEDTYGAVVPLLIELIDTDPNNRKDHDKAALQSLADSIKAEGLLQPIVVRRSSPKAGRFVIVAGERRFLAHKLNKAPTVPGRVLESNADFGAVKKRLVENMQREDLSPIEEARGYRELAVDHQMTQAEIAKLAGVGQPTVANTLRLLDLPAEGQQHVQTGALTRAHGVALARWAKWPKLCKRIIELAVKGGESSKDLERGLPYAYSLVKEGLVSEIALYGYPGPKYTLTPAQRKDPNYIESQYGNTWYCLAPDKWAPEMVRQDKIREKLEKAEAKTSHSTSGGKSQGAANAKKAKANKVARAKIAEVRERAVVKLGAAKDIAPAALIVLIEAALDDHKNSRQLKDAAKLAGVSLPKGSPGSSYLYGKFRFRYLHGMKPVDLVKLAAAAVLLRHADEAHKYVWGVPAALDLVANSKGGKAK